MKYTLFQVPVSQYKTQGAFLATPDNYGKDPAKKYRLIVAFGGANTAGTDVNRLFNDPPFSLIKAGMDLKTINPITGEAEEFVLYGLQDPTGAPWPPAVGYSLNFLLSGNTLKINNVNYTGKSLLVNTDGYFYCGLSYGGASVGLQATWDEAHAANCLGCLCIAPMGDIHFKEANWPLISKYKIPFWFVTGEKDGFLAANVMPLFSKLVGWGSPAVNTVVPGQGHSGNVWIPVYKGTTKITWIMPDGSTKALNWLEWFLAISTPAVTPPVDPGEDPEEPVIYTPTMERGSWVTLRRIGEPAGTVYRGQVLDFDAETGFYDMFNFEHGVIVIAGTPDRPSGLSGYYYEPAEPILKP